MSERSERRLVDLFKRARRLPAAERERVLIELQREDPELAGLLAELLEDEPAAVAPSARPALTVDARVEPPDADGPELLADALLAPAPEMDGYKVLDPCIVFSRIGQGGMGVVYKGHHANLDIEVAIKCLKRELAGDDGFIRRFLREARAAARINHPNVVRVFDVRESAGVHYMVMEYVRGETARQRALRVAEISEPEALWLALELARGLAEAHRAGLVHRDVKPENVLISVDGDVKLADLGLARPQEGLSAATRYQLVGTPRYIAPEQWTGETVGPDSDVWSFGATMHFVLTGVDPIVGIKIPAIMAHILEGTFPDVRDLRPELSEELVAILARCTARARGDRYPSAVELLEDLELAARGRAQRVKPPGQDEVRPEAPAPPSDVLTSIKMSIISRERATRRSRKRKEILHQRSRRIRRNVLTGVAIGALLIALAGGGVALFRSVNRAGEPKAVTIDGFVTLAPAPETTAEEWSELRHDADQLMDRAAREVDEEARARLAAAGAKAVPAILERMRALELWSAEDLRRGQTYRALLEEIVGFQVRWKDDMSRDSVRFNESVVRGLCQKWAEAEGDLEQWVERGAVAPAEGGVSEEE